MPISMRRRLEALERYAPAEDSVTTIAIVHVGRLGSSMREIASAVDDLSWSGRYSAYLVPGVGDVLEPTCVAALDDAGEQRWFDAATTYPHVLAIVDGGARSVFRFDSHDAERRFDNLPIAEREALLVNGDSFVWMQ